MGYVNNGNTVSGKNICSPVFVTVGCNTLSLSSIALSLSDGSECSSEANLMNLIKSNGAVGAKYIWQTVGRGDARHWAWVDEAGEEVNEDNPVNLSQGTAFVLDTEAAGVQVKTAGQVEMSAEWSFKNTVAGKNLLSNPCAKQIMLTDVSLLLADGEECTSEANLMNLIESNGAVGAKYIWQTVGRGDARHWAWVNEDGDEIVAGENDVPFAIGSGFVLDTEAAGVQVIFKQ